MYTIKYNMLAMKHQLETKTNQTYSWARIAEAAHIHSNTIQKMSRNETARVDLEVIAKLMTFFDSVGIETTVNDFFIVSK